MSFLLTCLVPTHSISGFTIQYNCAIPLIPGFDTVANDKILAALFTLKMFAQRCCLRIPSVIPVSHATAVVYGRQSATAAQNSLDRTRPNGPTCLYLAFVIAVIFVILLHHAMESYLR